MKTLKNCPFCGGSASIIETEGPDQTPLYTAVCQQCGVKSPDFAAAEEAAAVWQNRYLEQKALAAFIDENEYNCGACVISKDCVDLDNCKERLIAYYTEKFLSAD